MATFRALYNNLKSIANQFEETANAKKLKTLQALHKSPLPPHKEWPAYQHLLLFLSAHPQDAAFLELVNKEKERLSKQLKKAAAKVKEPLQNSGLPYTTTVSSYSHDLLSWLAENPDVQMLYNYSSEEEIELNHILQFTLPDLEKSLTAAENVQDDLLLELKVSPERFLPFLLDQFSKLNHEPYIKDFLWAKYQLYVELSSEKPVFSKLYNQLSFDSSYFHHNLIRNFDHEGLLQASLPEPMKLGNAQMDELIAVMRNALLLLERETDPTTYIDRRSIRFYQLERGISVAIYGMTPNRQMPMESYVGYTLFKNGFPAAYGGGWVHGKKSLFGINIFEQFRGGESGFLFIQLLRVYRQAFGVDYFEVEPYQYGLNNPEGIESGAFWFYYRYGFRPLDKELEKIAADESQKIKTKKGYRTAPKTLIRFTESNIALKLGSTVPNGSHVLREKVTAFIEKNYKSNRSAAIQDSLSWFRDKANFNRMCSRHEEAVLQDVALIAMAFTIQDEAKLDLLQEMVATKPVDLYSYQELLIVFLD